jgi:hypothetical protein
MNEAMNNWTVQLLGMVGIAAVSVAVFWSAEGVGEAASAGAILLAFIAIVHFGRRRSWRSCCPAGGSSRLPSASQTGRSTFSARSSAPASFSPWR